jgi:hypothetical protein
VRTRTIGYHWRPAAAALLGAVILGAVVLGGTAACGSAAPAGANAPASATTASGATAASASSSALSGLTAGQIAARATADLKTVSSVHVSGSVKNSGQSLSMSLTLGTEGCTGTLGIKGKGSFQLLKIGKKVWIKPDDKFWKTAAGSAGSAVLHRLSGKYIEPAGKGSSLGAIGELCYPSKFVSIFAGPVTGLVKGPVTTISGQPALQLKDTVDPGSAYVTISARPQFLRLDAGRDGHLDFTSYDAPMNLTPPPASETLDGAKYGF